MEESERKYSILQKKEGVPGNRKDVFAQEVLKGLSQRLKKLPTEYIYDERGSELFREIMALPEYYLTNCETEVLENNKSSLRKSIDGEDLNLIELGAGDGKKTKIIVEELIGNDVQFHYIPIDISVSAMEGLIEDFSREFASLKIEGIVSDYFSGLKWLSELTPRRNLVLFLGSNIGNLNPEEINSFLSSLWHTLNNHDQVLIGFDLKKNVKKMTEAYDDSRGTTADFNMNLLARINSELDGTFDLEQFKFYSTYDAEEGAIMSYLISQQKQDVYIGALNRWFRFKAWEPIHTESSYKFNIDDIEKIAAKNNFEVIEHYFDPQKQFSDSLWVVRK